MQVQRFLLILVATACLSAVPAAAEQGIIDSARIARLVEDEVLRLLQDGSPWVQGASSVEVRSGSLDSRLRFADCAGGPRVNADLSRANGRVNAKVSCGGTAPWSIYVPVEIHVLKPVVVTSRAIERGETIGPDDVTLEDRDLLASGGRSLQSLDEAIGRTPRRHLPAGFTLTGSSVESPVLVRRGERVNIAAKAGGISVSATAEAMSDGRQGQPIRVRNLQSGRIVQATVTGPGRAEII